MTPLDGGDAYPTLPCGTCGDPVYFTASGAWRHVERDWRHNSEPAQIEGEL